MFKQERLLRLNTIIGPNGILPISASTWHAGVKSGRYPPPVKLGPNIVAYRQSDIEELIQNGICQDGGE